MKKLVSGGQFTWMSESSSTLLPHTSAAALQREREKTDSSTDACVKGGEGDPFLRSLFVAERREYKQQIEAVLVELEKNDKFTDFNHFSRARTAWKAELREMEGLMMADLFFYSDSHEQMELIKDLIIKHEEAINSL